MTSMKTSLKNRFRILSNHFAIIPSRPVTLKKGIYVRAEERGPHPSSDRDGRIYRLAVPVLKNLFGRFTSQSCRDSKEMYKKSVIHVQSCCFAYLNRSFFDVAVALTVVVS